MSIDRLMDKQNAVRPYSGIVFTHKRERSPGTRYNLDEPQKRHAKRRKPNMNHAMYVCGSVYMKCWPRQIHSDGKRKSGCQGPGEEEGRGGQLLNGCGISYRGDKNVFGTLKEMAVAWHSEGTNCRGTVCSKTVHRVSGEFHLSSSNKC